MIENVDLLSRKDKDDRYTWLREAVQNRTDIITGSRRLARDLRTQWADDQAAIGKTAWLTPRIIFIEDWLSQKLINATDTLDFPSRLDRLRETMLWEKALAGRIPVEMLGFGGLVKQVSFARSVAAGWRIPFSKLRATAGSPDEVLFAEALADFEQLLSEGKWIDGAGLVGIVSEILGSNSSAVPKQAVFVGFHRFNPALEWLLTVLRGQSCGVTVISSPREFGTVVAGEYPEEKSEFRTAGAWARNILSENPRARVAIICPGLESRAVSFGGFVCEGLLPGWQFGDERHHSAVNVAYGRRLSDFPAVAIALLILRWTRAGLKGREISVILRSHFIAGEARGGRSRLELQMRSQPDREWSVGAFRDALTDVDASADATAFIDMLDTANQFSRTIDDFMSPHDCVGCIGQFLGEIHWPGEGPLDSLGFQLINRWRELLNELAKIDGFTPRIRLRDAISRLESLAADTVWQPETASGSVQLMGTLQAAGMEFDAIWIAGMDSSEWPPQTHPSSFISRELQRSYGVPDSTPAETLDFTKKVFAQLVGSARECVLSWSRVRDGSEQDVSALMEGIKVGKYEGPADPGWSTQSMAGAAEMIIISGDDAPPITEKEKVWGGAYTVQRQKNEPFSGFVYGRLGVRHPEPFSTGLTPGMRGSIVHSALYKLLRDRPGQIELKSWTESEQRQRISTAVDAALSAHLKNADDVLQQIIRIERDRLQGLLQDFLDSELGRPQFQIVDVEAKVAYAKFGVNLGFRIDRIDRLPDGQLLIIDYKTGKPKSLLNRWKEITEVQPVLYADAIDGGISGLLLLNVNSGEIKPKGVGSGWNGSAMDDWKDSLQTYIAEVDHLVEALGQGDIRVNLMQSRSDNSLAILSRLAELKNAQ